VRNIKFIKAILTTIFVIFVFTQSKSEVKIAFVEMDTIMKESLAGKSLIKQLSNINNDNKKYFDQYKKKLDSKKNKINSQKNILSKDEYEKKVLALNSDFESFKKEGRNKINFIESKRDEAMKKILSELKIILSEYSDKHKLTFIIDQKNIIIGMSDLNVTKEILELLNLKLKKISLN